MDSSTAISNVKEAVGDSDYQKYFVEIGEVINKEGDIEDLIHPELYYLSFEMAYGPILEYIPSLEEIEQTRENKKLIHKYEGWFNSQNKEFNKTLVAQQFFSLLMQDDARHKIENESLEQTTINFTKLIGLIKKKFSE